MIIFEPGYVTDDQPLTHARIAHSSNWIAAETVTASSTATDYYAEGPDNLLTYEKWKPSSVPATWENDFGASNAIDYCVIAAHNMGASGNSLQVQRYDSGSYTDMIPTTAITDDSPIMVIFTSTADTRYRIRVSGGSAPEIGVVKFGAALQMPRPIYGGHNPAVFQRQTILQSNISDTGEFLGRTKKRVSLTADYQWQHVTADWARTYWLPFQKAVETEPFVIAWRPDTFGDVALCQAMQAPTAQNMGIRDLMAVGVSARARGYD